MGQRYLGPYDINLHLMSWLMRLRALAFQSRRGRAAGGPGPGVRPRTLNPIPHASRPRALASHAGADALLVDLGLVLRSRAACCARGDTHAPPTDGLALQSVRRLLALACDAVRKPTVKRLSAACCACRSWPIV